MIAFKKFLNKRSLRAVVGEMMATQTFVMFSLASTVNWADMTEPPQDASRLLISVCFGLSVAAMVKCFSDISGAHINPAVTLAMVFTRKLHLVRAFFYLCAQCLGAIAGCGILYVVTPEAVRGNLGVTSLGPNLTVFQGFLVELTITFQMVFTVVATSDPSSTKVEAAAALTVPYTGASMNPARSLGPAVVTRQWDNHWVYWVGPILGSLTAAALHKYFLHPSLKKPAAGEQDVAEKYKEEEMETFQAVDLELGEDNDPESFNNIVDMEMDENNALFETEKPEDEFFNGNNNEKRDGELSSV
ncbi:hypothetical protein JZ751_017700 [Albula glossodonta]|uniref:Aquaporin-4 n=1 Tax=Albula glossodonta TaxID=121402 RepID=A0A8T2PP43_9TELE|nr:hypothetical protein JZ751_017700 [Albula glossodonta]